MGDSTSTDGLSGGLLSSLLVTSSGCRIGMVAWPPRSLGLAIAVRSLLTRCCCWWKGLLVPINEALMQVVLMSPDDSAIIQPDSKGDGACISPVNHEAPVQKLRMVYHAVVPLPAAFLYSDDLLQILLRLHLPR